MQIKLLKEIVVDISGPATEKIVDLLFNKKNVNEFIIAKKLELTINQTRNILYKLAEEGIVSFIRKKDKKKGGWYTYFWTLNTEKSLEKLKEKIESKILGLKKELKDKETIKFYNCKNCEIELDEENALLHEYTCPECGEVLGLQQTSPIIENIKKQIIELQAYLEKVNQELSVILEKEEKSKVRRLKAEQKKKEEERAKKRAAKKREIEKMNKKVMKKKTEKSKKSAPKKNKKSSKKKR